MAYIPLSISNLRTKTVCCDIHIVSQLCCYLLFPSVLKKEYLLKMAAILQLY